MLHTTSDSVSLIHAQISSTSRGASAYEVHVTRGSASCGRTTTGGGDEIRARLRQRSRMRRNRIGSMVFGGSACASTRCRRSIPTRTPIRVLLENDAEC